MRIVDFYPSQGSYLPGQSVKFFIEIESSKPETVLLKINIQHFFTQTALLEQQISLEHALQTIEIHWTPPTQPAGYSARAAIGSSPSVETAFDVLSNWIDFPRYGFLTNFSASNLNLELVFKKLTHFHINGLQFYDWQYRHNQLLASTETYIDPLGREMSLATIRNLVKTAHQHGMAAMPYLAIYAASADFWNAHLDWALYDEAGKPIPFGDNFLGLMDPSKDSAWNRHLLAEGARTLEGIPFDGMHIDQYGDPKFGWDSKHNPVDIPKAFVDFIKSAKEQHPDKTVLFNAVGNWPIEALAESVADFMYIEVWPPDLEYKRLAEIVLNAVQLSHGKAVVIALYLPANRPANNLLADAVILACGGTRIELGEDARLLSDPYFPKHEEISSELESGLKKFNDFAVRNGEWIRPYTVSSAEKETWAKSEFNPSFVSTDDSIWTVVRHHAKAMVLSLVNLSGLSMSQQWDQAHVSPVKRGNIFFQIQTKVKPDHIYWDSPESSNGPQKLDFQYSNGKLEFQIPQINYTGLIVIHE